MHCYFDEEGVGKLLESLKANLTSVEPNVPQLGAAISQLNAVMDAMEEASYSEAEVCQLILSKEVYEANLPNGKVFAELLFEQSFANDSICRDPLLRLGTLIQSLSSVAPIPPGNFSQIGLNTLNLAQRGALITPEPNVTYRWAQGVTPLYITGPIQLVPALRTYFVNQNVNKDLFTAYSAKMFPNLHFACPPDHIDQLGIPLNSSMHQIVHHLAFLNDHASDVFSTVNQANIGAQVSSRYNVNLSQESTKTRADARKMKLRLVDVGGSVVDCEWHVKFTKTYGRIHFNAFINGRTAALSKVVGNKVVVGVITYHLPI